MLKRTWKWKKGPNLFRVGFFNWV